MKLNSLVQFSVITLIVGCCGCSSIITGTREKVPVSSTPTGANITIYDKAGQSVATGTTPTEFKLKKKAGYFSGADYKMVIEKPGYKTFEIPIKHNIHGWYFGNFGFGGLIGFLVVDPLTGGMWKLKPEVGPASSANGTLEVDKHDHLTVVLKEQLSPDQQRNLEPVQPATPGR